MLGLNALERFVLRCGYAGFGVRGRAWQRVCMEEWGEGCR